MDKRLSNCLILFRGRWGVLIRRTASKRRYIRRVPFISFNQFIGMLAAGIGDKRNDCFLTYISFVFSVSIYNCNCSIEMDCSQRWGTNVFLVYTICVCATGGEKSSFYSLSIQSITHAYTGDGAIVKGKFDKRKTTSSI